MPDHRRRFRWGWLAATLAAGLLLVSAPIAPVARAATTQSAILHQTSTGITFTVRAGYDGYYKDGQWVPIRVTIANDGPDVSGTLQALLPHNNAQALYTRPVDLPTQSRREFFFYVPPEGYFNSPLRVDFVAGSRILASANARLTQATATDYLYGILASSPSAFNAMANIRPLNGQGYMAQLEPADLPPLAAAWKALDLLIISGVDTGTLSAEQRQALEDWVQQGGRLMVVGGPEWQKTSAGLGALLPVAASGTQSVADLSPLGSFASAIAPDGPALAATGQLSADAITLVTTGDVPAVVYRHLGFGLVAWLAFDPALAPLKGWDGMTGIFQELLTLPQDHPNWANGIFNWSAANEASKAVPGLAVPTAWHICGFLAVYVIVVGPLNFLILRRLKRRTWAWATIPALVLVFSGAAYFTGYGLLGTQAILNRLAIVEVWPGSERAHAEQIIGLFSPQRTTYQVTFEPGILARPIPYGGGLPSLAPVVVEQSDRTRLPAVHTEIGEVQPFVAQGQVPAPRFNANLTLRFSNVGAGGMATLDGSVTNESNLALSDAVLLAPGGVQHVGTVTPGQTVNVPALILADPKALPAKPGTIAPPLAAPMHVVIPASPGTDSTYYDILGFNYPFNEEQYRRSTLLSSVLDQYGYGAGTRGYGVYLVGWTSTAPLGAKVSVPFRTLDMSLYLIALPYTIDAGQGRLILPPGLLTWSALDSNQSNYTPYDAYLDPNSSLGFEFSPGLPVSFASVQALTLHLRSNGPGGPANTVRVELYDFTENTWAEQPGLVWGDNAITAPARYVGPKQSIELRITNIAGTTQNIVEADFTLEAER